MKSYSYEDEIKYYKNNPVRLKPYLHLEPYLTCWFDPKKIFENKVVLDIGAGECEYSRLIADKFDPKEITACDLISERMQLAKESNKNPKLKFVVGDCFNLPFKKNSFDVVFGSLILHQLPNLSYALSEVHRVLKDDGLYVGFEPNPFNLTILYRYLFKKHSSNQYLFWPWIISPQFEKVSFKIKICYFYSKLPFIKNRFIGTCIGIIAKNQK